MEKNIYIKREVSTSSSLQNILNSIIKKQEGVGKKNFVQMLEALGYGMELTYVKRNDEGDAL